MISWSFAFLVGAIGWTLLEYVLHRFVFHGPSAKGIGAQEHRRHHAQVNYFAPWWQKALAALVTAAILLPLLSLLAGMRLGGACTLGFISMYLLYEILHRRVHTRAPRGRYGRWLRKNHFAHHFVNPRLAHGVTTPLWDLVFGTRLSVNRVRVPRRVAMPWLVDTHGSIHDTYTAEYELVGSRSSDEQTRHRDTEAAMANERPDV
ncbi:MAG TPA: sterol desaturase family protein [Halioglobus sp.]